MPNKIGYDRKKYSLRKIPLDSGGYDPEGQYYGIGKPLYRAVNLDDEHVEEFRASTRQEAVRIMQNLIAKGKLEDKRSRGFLGLNGLFR